MPLTLAMLRCPDDAAPETRTVAGGEFSIGRGPDNDWVLPDPERSLSKRHCVLAFRSGGWQIADVSTNGTFLNREAEPIGRDRTRDLRSGDRLSFGAYEIEVQMDDDAARPWSPAAASADPFAARRSASPESFALDPFASASDRERPESAADPLLGGASGLDAFGSPHGAGAVALPADFDPLAPDPEDREFRGPTQSDHSPHLENAFSPPTARTVLPEDWDRETAPQNPAPERASPSIPPVAEVLADAASPAPGQEAMEGFPAGGASPPDRPAVRTVPAFAEPPPRPIPPPDDLLAAFLRGCGYGELRPADPAAMMEALGAAFRAVVSGLRQSMIARAAVKGEFRIEQTMIRNRGNNPLKFSADDDDALAALLGAGRRSDMAPAAVIDEAMRDIRLHELATVAAMQAAVRALLAEFAPAKLRRSAERGGLALLAAQRKAAAWDEFEALHARISQALLDDFDSVFGKAFARAYERAVAEISARDGGAP